MSSEAFWGVEERGDGWGTSITRTQNPSRQMPASSLGLGREVPQRKHRTYGSKVMCTGYLDGGTPEAVRSLSNTRQ